MLWIIYLFIFLFFSFFFQSFCQKRVTYDCSSPYEFNIVCLFSLFSFNIHVISAKNVLKFLAQTLHVQQLFISPEGNDSEPPKLKWVPQDGIKLCKELFREKKILFVGAQNYNRTTDTEL